MSRRYPPSPMRLPFLGALPDMARDPLAFVLHLSQGYGAMSSFVIGGMRVYFPSDPQLIEDVLVGHYRNCVKDDGTRELVPLIGWGLLTSEGEAWKHNRKLAAPPLSLKRIASYAATMVECTEQAAAGFRDGEVRDIHVDMMSLTLDIVGKTLLGFDARGEAARVAHVLDVSMDYFSKQLRSWHGFLPKWVPTKERVEFRKVRKDIDAIVYGIIERCRKDDREADHLLARLVHARDDDGAALTNRELRDEAITMLLAGHETTALALSFAIYLLSEHPDVATRLRDELDSKVGGRPLALTDIASLPYLDAVVRETLRLYPPAWAIGREVVEPFELGGYRLERGKQIMLSAYAVQRHPKLWPEPTRFRPERWLDGSTDDLPKFAYFPFGGGPRVCIGNHFATMEVQLVLGTLVQHFDMKVVPGFKLTIDPVITMRPDSGVRVKIMRRAAPQRGAA